MGIKISLIVPVYNIRDYIIDCLSSLINQEVSYHDYEIIVVNDGSTDDSEILVKSFIEENNIGGLVQVVNQENKGLSGARNTGFSYAKGKYVWFIDGDDWISSKSIDKVVDVLNIHDLDMFMVGPSIPFVDVGVIPIEMQIDDVSTGRDYLLQEKAVIGAWSYIYKKSFLEVNNLLFKQGIYYEDVEFNMRALFFCNRISMIQNLSIYNYRIREGSIMRSAVSQKKILDTVIVAHSIDSFRKRFVEDDAGLNIKYVEMVNSQIISSIKNSNRCEFDVVFDALFEVNLLPVKLQFSIRNGMRYFFKRNVWILYVNILHCYFLARKKLLF